MKRKILLDAFFYLIVPLLMWNLFRENLGDYLTILFGMLDLSRNRFNVAANKVPQLGMHLVGVPTGQMKHAHAARWAEFLRLTNS